MTRPEFLMWMEYHRLYPISDFHRVYRPAALIAQSLRGGPIQPLLDYLHPNNSEINEADMNTMRAMGFRRKGG